MSYGASLGAPGVMEAAERGYYRPEFYKTCLCPVIMPRVGAAAGLISLLQVISMPRRDRS
jgi:hypothetical protein